jgi:hypothetical protein
MKTITLLLTFSLVLTSTLFAQTNNNEAKKEINKKAMKMARKEAKRLLKEGWNVAPGSLPLEKLLEQSYLKAEIKNDKGTVKYLFSDGNGVAETKINAENQALEFATYSLASQIETNIGALTKMGLANEQLSNSEAASITKVMTNSTKIIAQKLGYIEPVFKIYRVVPGNKNNTEVQMRVFYEVEQSMRIAKQFLKEELKDELKIQEKQLDKLMGID